MFISECPECELPAAPLEYVETGAAGDILLMVCLDLHRFQILESEAVHLAEEYSQGK